MLEPNPKSSAQADHQEGTPQLSGRIDTGLQIDVEKANSQGRSQAQQPVPIGTGDGRDVSMRTDNQALESAGRLWDPTWTAETGLINTVRHTTYDREQTVPRGFDNEGAVNKCYRNSAVVALLNSQLFMSYVSNWHMQRENPVASNVVSKNDEPFYLLHELDALGRLYWRDQTRNTVTRGTFHDERMQSFFTGCNRDTDNLPEGVAPELRWVSWAASVGGLADEHQDSGEFLNWMLQTIERQLLRDPKYPSSLTIDPRARKRPQENFNYLFKIRLTERAACPLCQRPVLHRRGGQALIEQLLQLHMPSVTDDRGNGQLIDCVREYMNPGRQYKCARCGQQPPNDIPIQLKFQSLPEVLFVSINRQQYDVNRGEVVKNVDRVHIPEELDLSEWLEPHEYGEGSVVRYRLMSIILHLQARKAGLGHYISVVRHTGDQADNSKPSTWYLVNDRRVSRVNLAEYSDIPTKRKPAAGRLTPFVMVYHKIEGIRKPGRQPMNVGDITDKPSSPSSRVQQRRPEQNLPTVVQSEPELHIEVPQQSKSDELDSLFEGSPDPPHNISPLHTPSSSKHSHSDTANDIDPLWPGAGTETAQFIVPFADKQFKHADLFVSLKIGPYDFDFPRRVLEYFSPENERDLELRATIKASNPATQEDMYLDLMDAASDKCRWRRRSSQAKKFGGMQPKPVFRTTVRPRRLRQKP